MEESGTRGHRFGGGIRRLGALTCLIALFLFVGVSTASATPGGPGVEPANPIGEYSTNPAMPLSPAALTQLEASQLQTHKHWASLLPKSGGVNANVANASSAIDLTVGYQAQINYYYCGPATAAMIAAYLGVGYGGTATQQQNTAASQLATTAANGTAWYGSDNVPNFAYGSYYPVADSLDYQIWKATGNSWYAAVGVSGTPTAQDNTNYVNNLTFDAGYTHPLALNQWSIAGYQFYYQPSQAWQHWLVGRGYSSSGAYTYVNDPGFSAGNNASVPSTSGAHSVTYAVGGHGYIW